MMTGKAGGQDERKERLAQALRDNLRRRKTQARESKEVETPQRPDDARG
ncbi:hypothetical protein [Sphingobium estronivorans]|nr:hypothetical protein [Sphingobium estronivorans]